MSEVDVREIRDSVGDRHLDSEAVHEADQFLALAELVPSVSARAVPRRRTLRTSRVCGVMIPHDVRWSMCQWLTIRPGVLRTGSKMTCLRRYWTRMPPS